MEDVSREEFLTPKEELLLDKYRLTLNILQKESDLIEKYDEMVRGLRAGYTDKDTILKSIAFLDCWSLLGEIYHFMEFNKIADMKKTHKENVEKLQEIMGRYEDFKGKVTFDDLQQSFNFIRKFVSIAGYHEDIDKLAGSGAISSFQQRKKKKPTEEWEE